MSATLTWLLSGLYAFFNVCTGDLNSSFHTCRANTLTHWAIFPVPEGEIVLLFFFYHPQVLVADEEGYFHTLSRLSGTLSKLQLPDMVGLASIQDPDMNPEGGGDNLFEGRGVHTL